MENFLTSFLLRLKKEWESISGTPEAPTPISLPLFAAESGAQVLAITLVFRTDLIY